MQRQQELLEIYKTHIELADRVSRRRTQSNNIYISLLSSMLALFAIASNSNDFIADKKMIILIFSLMGIILCFIWFINTHSYKQLNSGKFHVILELEKKLAYAFYTEEWNYLKKGDSKKYYFKLTSVEKFVPALMVIPYITLFVYCIQSLVS